MLRQRVLYHDKQAQKQGLIWNIGDVEQCYSAWRRRPSATAYTGQEKQAQRQGLMGYRCCRTMLFRIEKKTLVHGLHRPRKTSMEAWF
ncbi:hypothetical protein AVEN_241666-1 [Araneus ventricosus]|uniref:Uncharacterized protein n=1 Tax=Araneus ventricosus TaxID=182803 RepID=A0A4Y2MGS9_ARAVE|nr:hypothetical protein AVEN_241666-1 [Araneus ventricosus]